MLKILNEKGEIAMIIEDDGKTKILSEELKKSFSKEEEDKYE